MPREAVRCHKCKTIIDITIRHEKTKCVCGAISVQSYYPDNDVFILDGDCKNVSVLWSYKHGSDHHKSLECFCEEDHGR